MQWEEWNEQIAKSPTETNHTPVFYRNGLLRLSDLAPESEHFSKLSPYDLETMVELEKAGLRHFSFISVSLQLVFPYAKTLRSDDFY